LVIEHDAIINGTPVPTTVRTVEERFDDLEGENVAIGLLWTPIERLSLGFRYDTAWTGDVDYKFRTFGTNTVFMEDSEKNEIEFPSSFTLGAASRVNDRLTIALDWTHADWSEFVLVNEAGERFSLVTGENVDEETASLPDATNTVRLGAEYVFLPRRPPDRLKQLWSLRGGLFYDEEPASNRPTGVPDVQGDGSPDEFWGISIGAGVQAFQRVNFDAAYQARFGFGVDSDRINVFEGFEEDVVQHRFLLSAVIYF
jgi:long-subunit fatty acid transport protein